jgi:Uma2 family endonuclease
MTTAEYLTTPETANPQELANGLLRVADSPMPNHQRAVLDLARALDAHVRAHALGEIWLSPLDVILDYDAALVVQPDLLFISNERSWIVTERVRGAPDLVIEVLSPNPRVGSLEQHIGWFGRYGVRECWLLHQRERQLEILRFDDGRIVERRRVGARDGIRSTVLPAFESTLDAVLRWAY